MDGRPPPPLHHSVHQYTPAAVALLVGLKVWIMLSANRRVKGFKSDRGIGIGRKRVSEFVNRISDPP